jgi:HK97 family phage major capsid protein
MTTDNLELLKAQRTILMNQTSEIARKKTPLSAADRAAFDRFETSLDTIEAQIEKVQAGSEMEDLPGPLGMVYNGAGAPAVDRADVLAPEQRLADWAKTKNPDESNLSFGRLLRGMATNEWDGAPAEKRAMSESVGASGGFAVPDVLSSKILDIARAKSQAIGRMTTVPMESSNLTVPKWLTDPAVSWRGEGDAFALADPTLGATTLNAKSLGVVTKVSLELLMDAGPMMDRELAGIFASAVATEWDRVALVGTGTNNEPRGILNTTGVTSTALTGAPANYDFLVDAYGVVQDNNYDVQAAISSPRVGRQLAKLKDTTNQPLNAPASIAKVPWSETTSVPVADGGGSNESYVFAGQFDTAFWGVSVGLQVIILKERYLADAGQIGFLVHSRGDIIIPRAGAFSIASEIQA